MSGIYNEGLCKKTHEILERENKEMCLKIAALESDLTTHKEEDMRYKNDLGKGMIKMQSKVIMWLCGLVVTLVLILFVAIMTGKVKVVYEKHIGQTVSVIA